MKQTGLSWKMSDIIQNKPQQLLRGYKLQSRVQFILESLFQSMTFPGIVQQL